ncbi:hypothetical protein PGQ11_002391 [Apiospora arundinis]|uniref:ABM domain-containing protein n=1 Tax=Apiospora arundinis TaxID=335852 RepID=A0ABR2JI08_9PEZI
MATTAAASTSPASDLSANGFSLHVTVHIAPENVPKFLEAFKVVFDLTTQAPECAYFEVYQSPEDPGTLSWVENWNASTEWFFKEQLTKEFYKGYLETTEPMFIKPREVKILHRLGRDLLVIKDKQYPSEI